MDTILTMTSTTTTAQCRHTTKHHLPMAIQLLLLEIKMMIVPLRKAKISLDLTCVQKLPNAWEKGLVPHLGYVQGPVDVEKGALCYTFNLLFLESKSKKY